MTTWPRGVDLRFWPLKPLPCWWTFEALPWACRLFGHDWSPLHLPWWQCRRCTIRDVGGWDGGSCGSPPGARGSFTAPVRRPR